MTRFLPASGTMFQHIPRTGGTTIEKALAVCENVAVVRWVQKQPKDVASKHALLPHFFRAPMADVRYCVAFVRHPLAYYESVWRWITDAHLAGRLRVFDEWSWHPFTAAVKLYRRSYSAWIYQMLQHEPMWCTRLVELYVGPRGGEFCDYIGRTETLISDFLAVMKLRKHDVGRYVPKLAALKRTNETRCVAEELTKHAKRSVADSERLLIDRFYGEESSRRVYRRTQ